MKSQKSYSDEYALSLLNEQKVEKVETPEELPDIIAIMDETFSDPAVLGEFETNKDYMPFVHSILRGEVANTISGYTDVSVLGGNTANSEFRIFELEIPWHFAQMDQFHIYSIYVMVSAQLFLS